mgnify:CR=1 FL=1|jgi:hypothetical protein
MSEVMKTNQFIQNKHHQKAVINHIRSSTKFIDNELKKTQGPSMINQEILEQMNFNNTRRNQNGSALSSFSGLTPPVNK